MEDSDVTVHAWEISDQAHPNRGGNWEMFILIVDAPPKTNHGLDVAKASYDISPLLKHRAGVSCQEILIEAPVYQPEHARSRSGMT